MPRADRLQTEIDRGFVALEEGKLDAAAAIAKSCQRAGPKNVEVIALAAAVADARGQPEDALALYRRLVELRPDDPVPRLCTARLELHDCEDPDAALRTVESAFNLIVEDIDRIEAIILKTEALLARDDSKNARETLSELSSSNIDDPEILLDLAGLAISAEDAVSAKRWIEAARKMAIATKDDELLADALHTLGCAHEGCGDRAAMIAAWQDVLRLDRAAPRDPNELRISDDEVERIALETLAELPANMRDRLAHVPIVLDEAPTSDLVSDGLDPRILGLFHGTPMPDDAAFAPTVTSIRLFKRNLERSAADADDLAEEIRITVLHETAHYFGLDEDELEALGLD